MKKILDITSEFMLDYYNKKVIKNPSPAEKRVLTVPGKLQPTDIRIKQNAPKLK